MSLDANQPTDQVLVSELPAYIRAIHAAVNALALGASPLVCTTLSIVAGDNTLVVGTDLSASTFELVLTSALGAATLEYLRGGTEGDVKIFLMQNNLVSFKDGTKADGKFYLNQLPVLTDFNAQTGDVIAFVNVGGNGALTYGYWQELWRTIAVK